MEISTNQCASVTFVFFTDYKKKQFLNKQTLLLYEINLVFVSFIKKVKCLKVLTAISKLFISIFSSLLIKCFMQAIHLSPS